MIVHSFEVDEIFEYINSFLPASRALIFTSTTRNGDNGKKKDLHSSTDTLKIKTYREIIV